MAILNVLMALSSNLINNSKPRDIIIYGNFGYIIDNSYNQIFKIDMTTYDASIWLANIIGANNIATDGTNIYVSTSSNKIYRIALSPNPTDTLVSYEWSNDTQLSIPSGMYIDSINNYMYVLNKISGTILQLNLTTGLSTSNLPWLTGLYSPNNIIMYNDHLYVSNLKGIGGLNLLRNNTISKISLTTKEITTLVDSTYLNNPSGLVIYQDYLYICNSNSFNGINNIISINLIGTPIISNAYSTNTTSYGMILYNNNIITTNLLTSNRGSLNIYTITSNDPQPLALIDTLNTTTINKYRLRASIAYGGFAYISDASTNSILRMNLTDNNTINTWFPTTTQPLAFATDKTYLYFSRASINKIYRIPLSPDPTGTLVSYEWLSDIQLSNPSGFDISSDYLYVSNRNSGTISKINLITAQATPSPWITGLYQPTRMKIYNNVLYVINSYGTSGTNLQMNNTVSQISLINPIITTLIHSLYLFTPFALMIYNDYLYVTNSNTIDGFFTTKKINLIGPSKITTASSSTLQLPSGIFSYNNFIYIENAIINAGTINIINIYKEVSTTGPIPINVSYNSNTKILSWNGISFDPDNDSFIIQDLTNNLNITTNNQTLDLTNFISQNPTIKLFDIIIRQVKSGIIGPSSNNYKINLSISTSLYYDTISKNLSWIGSFSSQFEYYIIRDLSKNLELYSNTNNINLSTFLSQNSSVFSLNITVQEVVNGAIGPASIPYTINLPPPAPTGLSYDAPTKVLTWIGTSPIDSFIIEDLGRGIIGNSNDTSFNLTTYISQNPTFTLLNVIVKQVTGGVIGSASNIYDINLQTPPAPTGLSYDRTTKILTWIGTSPFDSFIIEEPARGRLVGNSNDTSFNLTTYISQNPTFAILNITVKQVTGGVIGSASNIYDINLSSVPESPPAPPAPTGLAYNAATKVLSWIGTSPYEYFIIQDVSKGLDTSSNDISFNLTSFFSLYPSVTIVNITVKQVTSGIVGNAASITINLELPESSICFIEGTIIETDQGEIPIEMITNKNTINNLRVLEITKTLSIEDQLICIEKDSLGLNFPNKKTVVSQNHQFLFNGNLVQAKYLKNVFKIPYNGEILYNVLLEVNSFMIANNLICETLDVNNVIAHLYRSPNRIEITKLLNAAKDFEEYKQIALTHLQIESR